MRFLLLRCVLILAAFAALEGRAVDAFIEYSGPIFDVHLHTDPPASALGMPNPVTGVKPADDGRRAVAIVREECLGPGMGLYCTSRQRRFSAYGDSEQLNKQ